MVLMNSGGTAPEEWGTNVYIPKIVSGAKWCSAYSFVSTGSNEVCSLNLKTTAGVVIESDGTTVKGTTQASGTWAASLTSGSGSCFDMLSAAPDANAITN